MFGPGAARYPTPLGNIVSVVGDAAWRLWLEEAGVDSFRFEHDGAAFTGRREARRRGSYWYAYRRRGGRLLKAYLGRTGQLDLARLTAAAERLAGGPAPAPRRRVALPIPASRLIGREAELATLRDLLRRPDVRL